MTWGTYLKLTDLKNMGIIENKIIELEQLSHDYISKTYNLDQKKTIELLTEARIGGYSIIGEI